MSENTTPEVIGKEAEDTDEEYFQRLVKHRNSGLNYFAAHTNIEITDISKGHAKGQIVLQEHHGNPIGSVHGGCLFALADSVGGAAAVSRKKACTTVSASMNYVNAAMMDRTKVLHAEAFELKAGKSTCVYRVDITDDDGKLLATATNTYFYLKGEMKIPGAD